jgi:hypothetical protein
MRPVHPSAMTTASLLAPLRGLSRTSRCPLPAPESLRSAELANEIRHLQARGLRGRGARLTALLDEAGEREALSSDLDHYERAFLSGQFPVGGHDDPAYFGACTLLERVPVAGMAPAVVLAGVPRFRSAYSAAIALWHARQLRGTAARE